MDLLDLVVTISEVTNRWYYSEASIRRWIERGNIKARQSGSTWLIEVPSLLAHIAALRLAEFRQIDEKKV